MMNFSNETISQIVNAINENMSDIKSLASVSDGSSLQEAAQDLLTVKCNLSKDDAKEVVDDLMKGISAFDDEMENAPEGDVPLSVKHNLEKLSEGMDDESRRNLYASVLTALQMLTSGDAGNVEHVLAENSKLGLNELVTKIEETVNNDISLDVIGNSVKEGLDAGTLNELAAKIEMNKDEFRLRAALWIYILQSEGKIKLTESQVGYPPATIGTLTAAGVETIIKTNELKQGKISLETWQKVVKWILGIVITAIVLLMLFAVLGIGGLLLSEGIVALIGEGMIASVVPLMLTWTIAGAVIMTYKNILPKLSEFYDNHIVALTEKVKGLFGKSKETGANDAATVAVGPNPAAETESDSEVSTNGQPTVKPAMA